MGTETTITRRCTLVLGMHRGGTSMISGLLTRAGLQGPRTPLPADQWNVTGYGESAVLCTFHDRLLEAAETDWDSCEAIPAVWFASESAACHRAEAQRLLAREFDLSRPFVLKDPRISRLLPLWLEVFEAEHIAVSAVLVVRHPIEVAESLSRRDQLPRLLSLLAWLRHLLDGEMWSRGLPRQVVRYDHALADWKGTTDRLSALVGLTRGDSSSTSIEAFVQPELRHHVADGTNWDVPPRVAGWLNRTWDALLALETLPVSETRGVHMELDAVRREFDGEGEVFSAVSQRRRREAVRLSGQVRLYETQQEQMAAQIAQYEALAREAEVRMAQAQAHILTLESERAALRASMSWRVSAPLRWLGRLVR